MAATKKEVQTLAPIKRMLVTFRIKSISPMIQHAWSDKAKKEMRDRKAGKKTKTREACNPEQEGKDATYYTEDGGYGIKLESLKSAIISAAHKDIGIEKTLVRKALFIRCKDRNGILKIECDDPEIVEDHVRVGAGNADLRYRPYFYTWSVEVTCELDAELLQTRDLLTLVDRAGFGVGIGEKRPEKGGEYGRFTIDTAFPVEEQML